MKKLKAMACLSLSVCMLLSMPLAGNAEGLKETGKLISMEDVKTERLNNESESAVIYIDALGNYVFHNMPQQDVTRMQQELIFVDETREVRERLVRQPSTYALSAYIYDTEDNPVHIGTWSGQKAYARHTLGTQSTVGQKKYLFSTGDAAWYNRNGNVALPYRNGNATVKEHKNQIDVAKQTSFTVTNPDTDTSVSVTVNDFGPQQNTELGKKTIVDLDASSFTTLFGSTKVGRHVCTTYVEVQQYFN